MEYLQQFIEILLHLDKYLQAIVGLFGPWSYVILFAIIFLETGLIIVPFLPGDSLLFAAGSIAAISELNIHILALLLTLAAVLGDTVNYTLGQWSGKKIFTKENSFLFNKNHLLRTASFYKKYGVKTIILARFIPIIRTFAPFVAGIGHMAYSKFLAYNLIGAILWVYSFLYLSYFFGNISIVKDNFSLVIIAIIIISLLPALYELYNYKRKNKLAT